MLPLHNPTINLISSIEAIHTDIKPIHMDIELQVVAQAVTNGS
jgi:hypothetical protein